MSAAETNAIVSTLSSILATWVSGLLSRSNTIVELIGRRVIL